MPKCLYCDIDKNKLTKEHLWPASLHSRIEKSNREHFGHKGDEQVFFLGRTQTYIKGEPTVRDVCAECNNGRLSILDSYICNAWDKHFSRIVEDKHEVTFQYDYDLLCRWLLKMCYNSARIHNSDASNLSKLTKYILTGMPHPDNVFLHLQLSSPSDFDPSEIEVAKQLGLSDRRWEPRMNRVGHLGYPTKRGYGRLVRTVYIQSYLFIIHIFPNTLPREQQELDLQDFKLIMPFAAHLTELTSNVRVICKGLDAKESYFAHVRGMGQKSQFKR